MRIIIVFVFFVCTESSYAITFPFNASDARSESMGNAYLADAAGKNTVQQNPAALYNEGRMRFGINYGYYFNIFAPYHNSVLSFQKDNYGLQLVYNSVYASDDADHSIQLTGIYNYIINNSLSIGFNVDGRYFYNETFYSTSGLTGIGASLDAGVLYRQGDFTFGMLVENIFSTASPDYLVRDRYNNSIAFNRTPAGVHIGAGYLIDRYYFAIDIKNVMNTSYSGAGIESEAPREFNAGLEKFSETLILRLGIKYTMESFNIAQVPPKDYYNVFSYCVGFGFDLLGINFDIGYQFNDLPSSEKYDFQRVFITAGIIK